MRVFTRLLRSDTAGRVIGSILAAYLRFVGRTTRFVVEPADPYAAIAPLFPVITAMWHGEHLMVPLARRPGDRAVSLVSRSADGEIEARLLTALGIRAIRGSGAGGRKTAEKGGVGALRAMMRALAGGETVVLTADVPKVARHCGLGIVTLAKLSGRPIIPVAVVGASRIELNNWDRTKIPLPFGRGAMVYGEPIEVASDATEAEMEIARLRTEASLDAIHARAYALVERRR
jgi:lysophospholipid acyltransferase (LPLAT)-like uncharacterized protein